MPTNPDEVSDRPPHGDPPPEEERATKPPKTQSPTDEDAGWQVVSAGNQQRRLQVSHNIVQALTPKVPAQAAASVYKGIAPPPPSELYHGRGATVEHVIDGKPVYYYKIKYHRDLRKCKTVGSPVADDFQKLYGKL